MNPAQLKRLLDMGLITRAAYGAAVASLMAGAPRKPELHVQLPATILNVEHAAEEAEGNTDEVVGGILTGTITAYEQLIPSHQMILHAGCMEPRSEELTRIKLLRDHNMSEPIGYMLEVDAAREVASFQVAPAELERVSQEFADKLRDGLSIGFLITEYEIDDDWVLHVYAAQFHEVSVCAIPAVVDAGITDVAASLAIAAHPRKDIPVNRAQLAAALAAGTITQEQHDAALATLDLLDVTPGRPAVPVAPEVAAGPELQQAQPPAIVVERERSLAQINQHLAAVADTGDVAGFALALADIIPASDNVGAFHREDWLGAAWRHEETTRPWIDGFGGPQELNALKGKKWSFGEADENGDGGEPMVEEYAGNKTEIPSNEIGFDDVNFSAFRIAAGWDVDYAFEDFADPSFWPAFWDAVNRDYKRKSNTGIRTRAVAAATAGANLPAATTAQGVIKQMIKDVRPFGRANRIFLGDTLFDELGDVDTEKLPLWLKGWELSLDLAEGTGEAAKNLIVLDSALGTREAVAFDSRAAIVRERSPYRLQAVNVGRHGLDVGVYSYLRLDVEEPRAIRKRTRAAA